MAGKRQHYVPRFLQRGFLQDEPGDAERTWLHRRNLRKLTSIRDVGVSEFFYSKLSKDGEKTLDDLITEAEKGIDAEVSALRRSPVDSAVEGITAATLVTHLTVRTSHLRAVFQEGMAAMLDQFSELMSDTGWIRSALGIDGLEPSQELEDAVRNMMESTPFGQVPEALMFRVVRFLRREAFDESTREVFPVVKTALDEIRNRLSALIREAHNQSLVSLNQTSWRRELAQLSWRLVSVNGAILPDCISLVRQEDNTFVPFLLREGGMPDLVILPLAHDRLLVGSRTGSFEIDVDEVNRAGALCSEGFFISRVADGYEGLADLIGLRASEVVLGAVAEAVRDVRDCHPAPLISRSGIQVGGDVASEPPEFRFSLSCPDLGGDSVDRLSDLLALIVRERNRDVPLVNLDGMTFAHDYPAALESLDRGDPRLGVARSQQRDHGEPVAKCVSVMRDGVQRQHLVFQAGIAAGLLQGDEQHRLDCLHTIVSMLAHVAHTHRYEPGLLAQSDVSIDPVAAYLHRCIAAAPCMYYGARSSAFANSRHGAIYAELAQTSLTLAIASARAARANFPSHSDIDRFLGEILPHLSNFLVHTAEWLGHQEGVNADEERQDPTFTEFLRAMQLDRWLELFGHDLRLLYDVPGNFTKANVWALSRHVERLLWSLLIFAWPTEDGKPYFFIAPVPPDH